MTRLMEQAIERLRALPGAQQDLLAEFVLHELTEDELWAKTTEQHSAKLKGLVNQVLKDDADGR
jgi:hypothetical protein